MRDARWACGLVAGLAGGLLISLAACSETLGGSDPSTGLSVEIRKGPIQPVGTPGQPDSAPVEGATVVIRRADGSDRAVVHSGADGRASLALDPGEYRVSVTVCPGAMSLPGPVAATVSRGEMTSVALECDTGIR
ncbi:MAG: carboxypeptidase-like regulatory domain-containing protein [Gemmatimonadota bacterium]